MCVAGTSLKSNLKSNLKSDPKSSPPPPPHVTHSGARQQPGDEPRSCLSALYGDTTNGGEVIPTAADGYPQKSCLGLAFQLQEEDEEDEEEDEEEQQEDKEEEGDEESIFRPRQ